MDMDPNFLTRKPFSELKAMPFDTLFHGVAQQAQLSHQILRDMLPAPPMPVGLPGSNGSKYTSSLPGGNGSKYTSSLPAPDQNSKKRPLPSSRSTSPEFAHTYKGNNTGYNTMSSMPDSTRLDETMRRPQLA